MLKFLFPHYQFSRIMQISRQWLEQQEMSVILLDLDRTLLSCKNEKSLYAFSDWLDRKQEQGFRFYLLCDCCSGGIFGRSHLKRLADDLNLPRLTLFSKKLSFCYRKLLRKEHLDRNDTVLISDRSACCGNIPAAKIAGIRCIRVKPPR